MELGPLGRSWANPVRQAKEQLKQGQSRKRPKRRWWVNVHPASHSWIIHEVRNIGRWCEMNPPEIQHLHKKGLIVLYKWNLPIALQNSPWPTGVALDSDPVLDSLV